MQGAYIKYYAQQQGGRISIGDDEFGSVLKLPKVYQRGRGLGGVFSSFWKYLQPLLLQGANFVKDELIDTGAEVLRNLNTQKPIKQILRDKSVQVVDKLRNNAVDKINSMAGAGGKRKRKRGIMNGTLQKLINKNAKRAKCQMKTRATRVSRSCNNNNKARILDIFT